MAEKKECCKEFCRGDKYTCATCGMELFITVVCGCTADCPAEPVLCCCGEDMVRDPCYPAPC